MWLLSHFTTKEIMFYCVTDLHQAFQLYFFSVNLKFSLCTASLFLFVLAVGVRRSAPRGGETRLITAAFNLHPIAALGRRSLSAARPAALKEQREVKKSLTSVTCHPQPFQCCMNIFPYRNPERRLGVLSLSVIQRHRSSDRPSLGAGERRKNKKTSTE